MGRVLDYYTIALDLDFHLIQAHTLGISDTLEQIHFLFNLEGKTLQPFESIDGLRQEGYLCRRLVLDIIGNGDNEFTSLLENVA